MILSFVQKNFLYFFFIIRKVITDQKKFKIFFLQKLNIMIFSFYQLFKNQQFPQVGLFFGEKETLEESNEPSLIRVR